jgi:hypothetical protein
LCVAPPSERTADTRWRKANAGNCQIHAVEHDWRSPTDYKTLRIDAPPSSSSPSSGAQRAPAAADARRGPRPHPARRRSAAPPAGEDRRAAAAAAEEEESEGAGGRDPRADPDLLRRATVYRRARYSLHVGGPAAPAPRAVAASAALRARVAAWTRRELRALLPLVRARAAAAASSSGDAVAHGERREEGEQGVGGGTGPAAAAGRKRGERASIRDEWLVRFVVDVLAAVPARSCEAVELLAPHLGGEALAQLFLHELASWLRSPCATVEAWDRWVRYPPQLRMFPALDKGWIVGGPFRRRWFHGCVWKRGVGLEPCSVQYAPTSS